MLRYGKISDYVNWNLAYGSVQILLATKASLTNVFIINMIYLIYWLRRKLILLPLSILESTKVLLLREKFASQT